jgi:hypothetical protein
MSKRIPQKILDAGYRSMVHVDGWPSGCCFLYKGTDAEGVHTLITPKTRKIYTTKNNLTYIKRYA